MGINTSGAAPDPSAMLDVAASDKGILIPRVQLDDVNTQAPISAAPVEGLLIYNATGSEPAGYYYWDGTQWIAIATGSSGINSNFVLNGSTLELTDPGGTLTADLSSLTDSTDNDSVVGNEYNDNFTLSGDQLSITDPGNTYTVDLSPYTDSTDNDSVVGNEYNTGLSLSNDSLLVTDNGGTLKQDLSSLGGGGAYWSRNSADSTLYPSNAGDSVVIGKNATNGRLSVWKSSPDTSAAIYGHSRQDGGAFDNVNVGVHGEAQGDGAGSGFSVGVIGLVHPDSSFISNALMGRLGSADPHPFWSWEGNSALYADGNGLGKAGHFVGGGVTVNFGNPQAWLHVHDDGVEASLETDNTVKNGLLILGDNSSPNIRLDDDEILAQDNGNLSPLYIQEPGGAVRFHDKMNELSQVIVHADGHVGVGIDSNARDLNIEQASTNSSEAGIMLAEKNSGDDWSMFHALTDNFWFKYNDALASYIEPSGTYNTSDRRLKDDIRPMSNVLEGVMNLKPSTYHHKQSKAGERDVGVIAQDLKSHFPKLVDHEEQADLYGVNYGAMSVVAIKAIQEQQALIQEQRQRLEKEERRNEQLEERLEKLEDKVDRMSE